MWWKQNKEAYEEATANPEDPKNSAFYRNLIGRYSAYHVLWSLSTRYTDELKNAFTQIGADMESNDPHQNLITIASGANPVTFDSFQNSAWLDFHLVDLHSRSDTAIKVRDYHSLQTAKPIVGIDSIAESENHTVQDILKMAYSSVFQGGTAGFGFISDRSSGNDSLASHLMTKLNALNIDFTSLVPRRNAVMKIDGAPVDPDSTTDPFCAGLWNAGALFWKDDVLIYVPADASDNRIRLSGLSSKRDYHAKRFDPFTGEFL